MPAEVSLTGSELWVLKLEDIGPEDRGRAGGKAVALSTLQRRGLRIPAGLCVLTSAYDRFIESSDLRATIALELGRKAFEDMRWEEIWDASLRIRNLFLRAPVEPKLAAALEEALAERFADGRAAVVRSSAPAEDASTTSFAGLHDSYVNVRGIKALLESVRRVWASLWTDRALLYRKELELDVLASSMAVVVQELIPGGVSGIAFSQNPLDESQAVVEAVWGLNEGLVDGTIEPDRWVFERNTRMLVDHFEPPRTQKVVSGGSRPLPQPTEEIGGRMSFSGAALETDEYFDSVGAGGTRLVDLSKHERATPPLSESRLEAVVTAAFEAEYLFGRPQDVEWTIAADDLWVLQSRPISTSRETLQAEADNIALERAHEQAGLVSGEIAPAGIQRSARDERPWYMNLHKSFETLRKLRHQVEDVAIPQMKMEADSMAAINPASLSDEDLADEITRRKEALAHWEEVYYRDFIPLAHGVRLFGQVYNDHMRAADPYQFVDLLAGSGLMSVSRNAALEELANRIAGKSAETTAAMDDYLDRFGSGPGTPESVRARERERLSRLLREMAQGQTRPAVHPRVMPHAEAGKGATDTRTVDRTEEYLGRFRGDERRFQQELLDLARASYRLRDDDNHFLGRFQQLTEAALAEARERAGDPPPGKSEERGLDGAARPASPAETAREEQPTDGKSTTRLAPRFQVRQLVGQPAGPGLAVGRARVCLDENDLYAFSRGEVLVCDSLDPGMTFVAPLAAAVVERRGGMLVHGAIIAREYGLPCVTGVPEATKDIRTGDLLTVDGFLGIVVVGGTPPGSAVPEGSQPS